MNEKQRQILAIVVPALVLIVAFGIADGLGRGPTRGSGLGARRTGDPFDWDRTWHVWAIAVFIIGAFELWVFGDSKNQNRAVDKSQRSRETPVPPAEPNQNLAKVDSSGIEN